MSLNNNVSISAMYDLVRRMVEIYRENIKPTPFQATFHVGNVRVDVKVSETKPERVDEDDKVAD